MASRMVVHVHADAARSDAGKADRMRMVRSSGMERRVAAGGRGGGRAASAVRPRRWRRDNAPAGPPRPVFEGIATRITFRARLVHASVGLRTCVAAKKNREKSKLCISNALSLSKRVCVRAVCAPFLERARLLFSRQRPCYPPPPPPLRCASNWRKRRAARMTSRRVRNKRGNGALERIKRVREKCRPVWGHTMARERRAVPHGSPYLRKPSWRESGEDQYRACGALSSLFFHCAAQTSSSSPFSVPPPPPSPSSLPHRRGGRPGHQVHL